jgi:hypothetical protein
LPCVYEIKKAMYGGPVVYLLKYNDDGFKQAVDDLWSRLRVQPHTLKEFNAEMDAFCEKYPITVRIGDSLIEQDDGSWRVEKGGKK